MIPADRWVWDFIAPVPELEAELWDAIIFWHVPRRAFARVRNVGDGPLQRWDYEETDTKFLLRLACCAGRLRPREGTPLLREAILSDFTLPRPELALHTNEVPKKPRGRPLRRAQLELVK